MPAPRARSNRGAQTSPTRSTTSGIAIIITTTTTTTSSVGNDYASTSSSAPTTTRDEQQQHQHRRNPVAPDGLRGNGSSNSSSSGGGNSRSSRREAPESVNTPRMWTLSILFAVVGSSINLFFSLRYPSVTISPVIAVLVAHPLGLLWDKVLALPEDGGRGERGPERERLESVGSGGLEEREPLLGRREPAARGSRDLGASTQCALSWARRLRIFLAQGRWNAREHCCVFISSNVSFGFAFATDVIVEQVKFCNQDFGIVYQILLTLSTQILGYALAGAARSIIVRPKPMVWPANLAARAMFSSLHDAENVPANGWTMSRFKFFIKVFLGSALFYVLPGFLMPALSWFNVVTWFAPKNVIVANLFGTVHGLGMFPMTFDWAQIAYVGSPLVVPFWAALNCIGGLVLVIWIVAPILYYTNAWYSSYMPILSSEVFDNTGSPYNITRILTNDLVFNDKAYREYSRVFLPITYVLSYAMQFAALPALIVHTVCWYGRDIWKNVQLAFSGENESIPGTPTKYHRRRESHVSVDTLPSAPELDTLIREDEIPDPEPDHEDVPISWYLLTAVSMAVIGVFIVEYYPVHLPWYGLLLALAICTLFFVPIGIIMAITNQQCSLYLIAQFICGYLFPGRPVANMLFVTYCYITSTQGLKFASDFKLGQIYMHISPRHLFLLQLTSTVISSLTQVLTLTWLIHHIPTLCSPSAPNGLICPLARVHFNGSILWGVIGPSRFFGQGQLYRPLLLSFLIGTLAPLTFYLLARRDGARIAPHAAAAADADADADAPPESRSMWRHVNVPVALGALAWIPPATGLNFSVWGGLCWAMNRVVRRRWGEWWQKYNMTLSAGLDAGTAIGALAVFVGVVYPAWAAGWVWWGTEVFKQGCDWAGCPYRETPVGGTFGPDTW